MMADLVLQAQSHVNGRHFSSRNRGSLGARLTPQEEQEQASQEPAQLQVAQVLEIEARSASLNHCRWLMKPWARGGVVAR